MISYHKSDILAFIEPRVSGAQADETCLKVGFPNWVRVEAVGFSGGIWIFWKMNSWLILFEPIISSSYYKFLMVEAHLGIFQLCMVTRVVCCETGYGNNFVALFLISRVLGIQLVTTILLCRVMRSVREVTWLTINAGSFSIGYFSKV